MNLLLVTVQHTGTRFFEKIIERELGKPAAWHMDPGSHRFVVGHSNRRCLPHYRRLVDYGYLVATTHRDWHGTMQSWLARRADEEEFFDQLDVWYDWVKPNAAVTLSFENQKHSEHQLWRFLGVEKGTIDWSPVGHYDRRLRKEVA